MKTFNWGILGLGKIAHTFAEDLLQAQDAKLYAVASRTKDKADTFAHKFNAEKAFGNYDELINDPKVDVIYIATPHAFHFEIAMQCLKAKKHILCEKPMCLNAKQTLELIEEAKSQNCFLMEGIWTRFIPATIMLLDLLKSNRIGKLISVEADFGFVSEFDSSSRLFNKSLGGGSLLDIGIYPVFLSLLCCGIPTEIKAMARKTSTDVDSFCSMLLGFSKGEKAILKSSFECETPTEAIIYGSKGSIKLHSRFHHSECIEIFDENLDSVEKIQLPYKGNGYIHEIEEVNSCIGNSKTESDLLPLDFSLQLAKVLDRIKTDIDLTY
ncbi:Gfo/Idh/MocA family protein [Psychroflexus aestuariivivens]|uniref:Gfo/Idh/MocA family protein n=1 Tax=Psychroflexus aestuariivivens TaxID=1795040 RepID=UPI000FDBC23A|nr:Gfo/Idh/MocA family oxidoreductase [Psychroflexus aestuariivivens]